MLNLVECQHCGQAVHVSNFEQPLEYVTREADSTDPKSFLIIGRESGRSFLLHRCVIDATIRPNRRHCEA